MDSLHSDSLMNALGSVLGSVASAGIGAASSKAIQKMMFEQQQILMDKQQRINRETMAIQHDYNVEDYYRQLTENTPYEQLRRYVAAGLSPSAAAQAVAGNSSVPSIQGTSALNSGVPSPPSVDTGFLRNLDLSSVLSVMRSLINLRKDSAEADKADAEAEVFPRLLLSQEDIMHADLALKRQEWSNTLKSFPYQVRIWRAKAKAEQKMPAYIEAQTASHNANVQQAEMNVKLARQQFDFLEKMNDKQIKEMTERINNLITERGNLLAARKVMGAQSSYLEAQTETEGVKKDLLKENVFTAKLDNVLKEYGSPDDTAGRMAALLASGQLKSVDLFNSMLGLRQVVKVGHKVLSVSPETKEFLYNYWDKGSMNANKLGWHSYGTLSNAANSVADGLFSLF